MKAIFIWLVCTPVRSYNFHYFAIMNESYSYMISMYGHTNLHYYAIMNESFSYMISMYGHTNLHYYAIMNENHSHFGAIYINGMTLDPPFCILDIQRGPDNESLCKVWGNYECGVFFKWI